MLKKFWPFRLSVFPQINQIVYLPRQLGGRIHPFRSLAKGVVLMYVTYNDLFTFVLMILAIITLVKNFYDNRKK